MDEALSSAIYVAGLICGLTGVGAWMYFVSAYTGRTYHRNRRYRGLAVAVYVGLLVIKLTNPIYGLYVSTELQQSPYTHLVVEPQLFYWVSFSLTYTLVAISFYWLITTLRKSSFPTGILGALAALALSPILPRLAVNALPNEILPPIMLGLSLEPLGVTAFLAGVLVLVDKPFRQIEQSARLKFFEEADDATFVYGTDGRLVELNTQAQELESAIDTELQTVEAFEQVFTHVSDLTNADAIPVEVDGATRYFEMTANRMATGAEVVGTVATVRDITKPRERQRELEQYETVAQTASDVIITIGADSIVQDVNPAVSDVFGYEPQELIGGPLTALMPDRMEDAHAAGIGRYLSTGERALDWDFVELPGCRADGTEIPLGVSFSEYEFEGERYFTGIIRDISEAKERENELQSFQRAVEETADGVAILEDGEYVYVDQTHVDMYGFDTEDDLLGETWRKLYDDDEVARLEEEAFQVLEADGHWRGMVTGSRPDGSTFPVELSLTIVEDGRLVCTVRDETERQARERELELKERAMDEATVGIQITDATQDDNPLIYVNDGFERMTGYTSEEAIGRNSRFLQGADSDPEQVTRLREAISAEEPVSLELENCRKDGTPYWTRLSITPVTDEDGAVTNYVGIQQDVTERRERRREAEKRVELLERMYEVTTDPEMEFEEKVSELLETGSDHLDLPYGFLTRIDADDDPTAGTQTILEAIGSHERLQPGDSGPLSESYCQRTIEGDGAMALTNGVESELVDEVSYDTFGLEAYIGGNVVFGDDVYGTLCFASDEQRELSFDGFERTFVSLLGQWAGYEIERRDARERLESSRQRYQTLLQAAPDPIFVADAETGEILEANAAAEELRGQPRDDLIGQYQSDLHPEANIELYADIFGKSVGNSSTITELSDGTRPELVTFDGETIPIEISAASVSLPDGPVLYGVFRDISDREERQRELELKERAMNEANVGITISDPDREDNPLIYVNDEFVDQTGYTREDVLGRNCRFLQGDDRDQPALDELRDAIAADEPVTVDLRNYRKDGEQFWNRLSVTPIYEDGELANHIGIQQDVTDEVRRKQRLYEERERFRLLTESVNEYAFLIIGEDGHIQTWNAGAETLFGYDADAARSMSMAELHPESDRKSGLPERLRQQANLAGESVHEGWQVRADGSEFYADVRYAPLESDDGEFRGYAMIVRDMTERRRQRRRTERFVEESEDVVNIVDPDGTVTYASGSTKRVFGYDPDAIVDENLFDYLHPSGRERAMETFFSCVEESNSATIECRLRSPDGDWLNVELRYRNMLDDDAIEGMLVYLRDVTEQKERARRFESIFNQTFQFTGLLESDGTVLEANDAALNFGGFEREKIIGKPFFDIPWWTHSEAVYDEVQSAIERAAGGEFVRYETEVRGGDGLATIDFSVKPVTNEDGDVSLLVVEGRDITGQQQRNRHLRVMQRVMRHNMRNDLGKMRGWTELMSEEADATERAEQFGRVEPILDKWDSMTEKMKEINRVLESEDSKSATTASGPMVEDVATQIREEYTAATVLTDGTDSESVQVPTTLRKAVSELVENAVKVTETATVEVTVRSDDDWVEISVTDDGPGMPEMEADVLESGEEDPLNHGEGLGLWMVRMIVTQAGGTVSAESTTDGTEVRLRVPSDQH